MVSKFAVGDLVRVVTEDSFNYEPGVWRVVKEADGSAKGLYLLQDVDRSTRTAQCGGSLLERVDGVDLLELEAL
jgi:hypothetical protein